MFFILYVLDATHRYLSQPIGIFSFRGLYIITSKYRFDYLVDDFIEVFLFDATKATIDITLDIARNNLAFNKAGLRESKAINHFDSQRIRILRVEPIV